MLDWVWPMHRPSNPPVDSLPSTAQIAEQRVQGLAPELYYVYPGGPQPSPGSLLTERLKCILLASLTIPSGDGQDWETRAGAGQARYHITTSPHHHQAWQSPQHLYYRSTVVALEYLCRRRGAPLNGRPSCATAKEGPGTSLATRSVWSGLVWSLALSPERRSRSITVWDDATAHCPLALCHFACVFPAALVPRRQTFFFPPSPCLCLSASSSRPKQELSLLAGPT